MAKGSRQKSSEDEEKAETTQVETTAPARTVAPPRKSALDRLPPALRAKKLAEKTAAPEQRGTGAGDMTFRTFLSVSKIKPDQLAGFASWVRARAATGRKARPEWEALLGEFQSAPTLGGKVSVKR